MKEEQKLGEVEVKEAGEESESSMIENRDSVNETKGEEAKFSIIENEASVSPLEEKISHQVEYYFGDINLPRDKFLLEEMKKDDGWISIDTMMKFNRLKALSSDCIMITKAIRKSASGLIEVSEDNTKIRRTIDHDIPENSLEYWQRIKDRTVYVKGFAQEVTSLDDLQSFFRQFGHVENVLMRRTKAPNRIFKGSVFVTYEDAEMCRQFVANDTKKYKDMDLVKLMQNNYWKKKQEEQKLRRAEEKATKKAKRDQLGQSNIKPDGKKKVQEMRTQFSKGLVLQLRNLPLEGVTFDSLKTMFKRYGSVGYVAYEKGATEAQIRFSGEENAALVAWDKALEVGGGKVMIGDTQLEASLLEGKEEAEYWRKFNDHKANKSKSDRQQGAMGSGKGGRSRGRGLKRKGDGNEAVHGSKRICGGAKKTVFPESDDDDEESVHNGTLHLNELKEETHREDVVVGEVGKVEPGEVGKVEPGEVGKVEPGEASG